MKQVFLAATRQNQGKTMVALGLIAALKKRYEKVGFIKPVGQRYVTVDKYKIDEDSLLIGKLWDLGCSLQDMSPIAVEKDFTVKYISHPHSNKLIQKIKRSYNNVSMDKDITIIEGTGHAGVGSVFDLSNAAVAKLLNAKVIIISSGGIGRPIDQIMLNQALFKQAGVEVIGAIVNKIYTEKYNKISRHVKKGLERQGIDLLGAIPYRKILSSPTMGEIMEETNAELINAGKSLDTRVEEIVVGAMTAHQAIGYFHEKTLIITPGDRDDLILAAMTSPPAQPGGYHVGGIILTGNVKPHKNIIQLIQGTSIPILSLKEDTYSVASKIHDIIFKIRPSEKEKINVAVELVEQHVDIDRILNKI